MNQQASDEAQASSGRPLRALARASRALGNQPDPAQALWNLVNALREDLEIDRAGVFDYDPVERRLNHVAGVDQHGEAEFGVSSYPVDEGTGPLRRVARREVPYYFTDDVTRDHPEIQWKSGIRAHACIPVLAGDELLGVLCVDNVLSGRALPQDGLDALFLYAGLAALPLFSIHQRREQERVEALRWHIHREVLAAVTSGKIQLCTRQEIDAEWPELVETLAIEKEQDVREVREAARRTGVDAGMAEERAMDLGLCVSEAATNALLHGRGGIAAVGSENGCVRVRICDNGEGISPEDLPRATLLKGWSKRASMGLGFTLINETADRLYLHTGPTGTTVIIEMHAQPEINLPEESNPWLWGEDVSLSAAARDGWEELDSR